ncbi:PA14 domain-containing protein [Caulobacter sp. KR2-114]|uniref:PA14 domain-containing protein n=1 Tax=Caulobacter sp. KR2-114 TaxID=3400912 RepID=UPI003C03F510
MELRPICAAGLLLVLLTGGCQRAPGPSTAPLGGATPMDRALKGELYLLAPGTEHLPDLRRLKPAAALYVRSLDIPDQDLNTVFPDGVRQEQPFAVDYTGTFNASTPGVYGFRLLSDDGARLMIDGRTVIANEGVVSRRAGEADVALGAGPHRIEVQYFQAAHAHIALQLGCRAPGGRMATFPGCGLILSSTGLWRVWLMWVAVLATLGALVIWQTRRRIARESRAFR